MSINRVESVASSVLFKGGSVVREWEIACYLREVACYLREVACYLREV